MAAYTEVFVCNLALGHIGIGQTIADLAASSHIARACSAVFDHAREEVLERFPWPMISRRVTLNLIEEDPNTEWARSYEYPNGCIAVRRLVTGSLPQAEGAPFEVAQTAADGRVIYTDQESAIAEVSYWFDNPGEWPSYLAKAISWNLATYICGPLGKGGQRPECVAGFESAITNAAGLAAREKQNHPRPPSSYTACR